MSTPWFVLPANVETPVTLDVPRDAPMGARYLAEALRSLRPVISQDVLAGHANSRRVRLALAQLAASSRVSITLSRAELARAAQYLIRLHERARSAL